jgi:C-terminal processing protease CtpA/Prc
LFSGSIGGGVWCTLPLALFADASGTLPRGRGSPPMAQSESGHGFSSHERSTRLADVILFWNIAQHFYPYFDVVGTDWPGALRQALRRAASDSDAHAFHETLCRLLAALHDGHAWVQDPNPEAPLTLPLVWDWVEDRLVITQADDATAGGPRRGDIVLSIDGETVAERMLEVEPLIGAATPQRMRWGALLPLARGAGGDSVVLELQSPTGVSRRVQLGRAVDLRRFGWDRPDKVADVKPGVLYVDLTRCTVDDLDSCATRMAAARGIVFDMRGYPYGLPKDFFGHLTDHPVSSPQWGVPVVTRPDREDMTYDYTNWTVPPIGPRFTGQAAFLMDGRDQSGAETYLQIVSYHRLAELVGGPTAGTDGTAITVALPSGHRVRFTGMRVLKQDGSQLHGVGVLPTVPVTGTLAGVAAGRDEVLEAAIQVVSR